MGEQYPLETLYRLVPATQDEDLRQAIAEERDQPHEPLLGSERYWPRGPYALEEPPVAPAADDLMVEDPFDDPTPAQALGLVLQVLGGSVLPDP